MTPTRGAASWPASCSLPHPSPGTSTRAADRPRARRCRARRPVDHRPGVRGRGHPRRRPLRPAAGRDPPRHCAGRAAVPASGRELTGPRLVRHDLLHLFTEPAGRQAEHLLALHAEEPADALVGDTAFVGAYLAAERAGLPIGIYGISVFPYASRDVAPFGSALPPRSDLLGRVRNRVLGAALRRLVAGPTTAELDRQRRRVGLPPAGRRCSTGPAGSGSTCSCRRPASTTRARTCPRSCTSSACRSRLPAVGLDSAAVVGRARPPAAVVVTQGTVATDPGKLLRPALAGLGRRAGPGRRDHRRRLTGSARCRRTRGRRRSSRTGRCSAGPPRW